ncbi:MAG: Holliday junction branch migration protein RuvA [Spirochaetes bacterium]|nr:Holliday junction branch migration protein RuvA [Spirochaetota bacterium]
MIAFIKGILEKTTLDSVIVDVQGIGYEIHCSTADIGALANKEGQPVALYTHLIHKEDQMQLFGFLHMAGKQGFLKLLKVSGIGARVALNILSHYDSETLFHHIQKEDVDALTRIPGIGPKSAKKIIFDLKGVIISEPAVEDQFQSDLISAFVNLGYKENEIKSALEKMPSLSRNFETDFKGLLKILAKSAVSKKR